MSTLFKKVTSAISVGAILASTIGTSIVAASSEFLPYAEALAEANVINKQSSEAGYRLADNIVRQEVAKVMLALNKATYAEDFSCVGKFSDVSATKPNDWACKVVETALSKGLISANTKFRPEDNITRAEALKMILKGQGVEIVTASTSSFNDVTEAWQINATETALSKKYISANASFRPNANITRGELFKMAASVAGLELASDDLDLEDLFGDEDTDTGTVSTGTTSTGTTSTGVQLVGDVTLALNPASPASQSVPQVGTVTFAKYDVKAGSSDVTLNSINLVREGLGNRTDFSRVWFEKNGIRVSGRQSIGSDNTVSVSFSPALVIKAGATESVDLVASLSGTTTGGQHKFTVLGDASVVSSAKVGGTFPLSTATMTTANYSVAVVQFQTGTTSGSTYKVGDKGVELGQFKLFNNATDDKTVSFKSITLRDADGDASKNLANLAIYKNNVKVSSGVIFNGKDVTFAINDSVAYGRTETYYIRADIETVTDNNGDSYQFTLQNSDDINVVENTTGFKATIKGLSGATFVSTSLATYNVTGGDVIFSKTAGTVTSQTIAPGANDVVLLSGDLKVAQAINLEDIPVTFTSGTGLSVQFSSLKLKIGNAVVSTYTPSTADLTSGTITFDGTFTITANTTIQVLGNVKSTAAAAAFQIGSLNLYNATVKEYVSNGNAIQSAQFAGAVTGISSTVGTSILTLTRNDGISNQSLAVGSQGVTILAFDMKANDVSDVTVTKLKFSTGTITPSINPSNIDSVKLYVNNTEISTKSMSSGNADFNDISFTIPKNGVANIKVVASFSQAINANEKFEVVLSDIDARDVSGNNLADATVQAGPQYTFITAGSAVVATAANAITSMIVSPTTASGGVLLARITLTAQNDDLMLTDLYLKQTASGTLSNLGARAKFYLYDNANINFSAPLATGTAGTGTISFNIGNSSTFTVPKNNTSGVTLAVYAVFNDVTDTTDSAALIQLTNGYDSTVVPVSGTDSKGLRLVSKSTTNTLSGTITGSYTGAIHMVTRAKPTIAAGSSSLSTHSFTVTASNNDLKLDTSALNYSLSYSGTAGTFTLYKDQDGSTSNIVSTGTISSTGVVTAYSGSSLVQIAKGETKTFYFHVSTELQSGQAVNTKRIFKINDFGFRDMLDNGEKTISSVSNYSNVGLPTNESTFTY